MNEEWLKSWIGDNDIVNKKVLCFCKDEQTRYFLSKHLESIEFPCISFGNIFDYKVYKLIKY